MLRSGMTPREQGDFGERSALNWLADQGAHVYLPFGHSPDIDLIAVLDGRLVSVEVKTTCCTKSGGRWHAPICTRGGNQSWSGLVKYFDASRCDYLFVHVGDGRRWFIPTAAMECRTAITLGGSKYSEFEIEPGAPMLDVKAHAPVLDSATAPGECQSGQMDEAVNLAAMPTQVRILSPPSPQVEPPPPPRPAGRAGTTKPYPKRRVTIPAEAASAAGISVGDRLRVVATDAGTLEITRVDEPAQPSLLIPADRGTAAATPSSAPAQAPRANPSASRPASRPSARSPLASRRGRPPRPSA